MAELLASALSGISLGRGSDDDDNKNNNNDDNAPALASPPPPPPIEQQEDGIAPPPPPLPFAAVLRPLLEQKTLSAVDVCELGCVNRELSRCVREFWQADLEPGSRRRLLLVADGAEAESDGRAEGGVVGASPGWPRDKYTTREYAQRYLSCLCCGVNFHDSRRPGYEIYTFPYPFDDADSRGRNERLVLCRDCYSRAGTIPAPPHSRAAHCRLVAWDRLVDLYGCDLPRSILFDAVPRMRPVRPKSSHVFCHSTPHACVRRVANYVLLTKTPRELQAHWTEMAGGG